MHAWIFEKLMPMNGEQSPHFLTHRIRFIRHKTSGNVLAHCEAGKNLEISDVLKRGLGSRALWKY